VVAQSDEDMQIEQLLCWNGMTNTEHSTTSSSNEEEEKVIFLTQWPVILHCIQHDL